VIGMTQHAGGQARREADICYASGRPWSPISTSVNPTNDAVITVQDIIKFFTLMPTMRGALSPG